MIYLPRRAAALAAVCGDGERYVLGAVRVQEYDEGFWRLDATDGRKLAVLRGPSLPHRLDGDAAAGLPDAGEPAFAALVPCASLVAALKDVAAAPKGNRNLPERKLGVRLAPGLIHVWAGDSVRQARPADGRFPDVDAVLPKGPARFSVRLDAGYLIDLLRVAVEVTRGGDRERRVTLHYWSEGAPVALTARGKDGVLLDCLLMPLT